MPVHTIDSSLQLKVQNNNPEDEFEKILSHLGDSKYSYKTGQINRSLIPAFSDCEPNQSVRVYHRNYMEYLTRCWAQHYSVVVEPNIVWYTLLCELASKVKEDPETYRHIFTSSEEKKDIVVPYNGGGFEISLDLLLQELSKEVPTDTNRFFPEFTTNNFRNRMAKYAAFADMASPYYDYFMLACGFPSIDVRGTVEDWQIMSERWSDLGMIFPTLGEWFVRVQSILDDCAHGYNNPDWWKGMYSNERCGSGHEVEIAGWFSELFYEKCSFPKVENFPPCVAIVKYTRINLHSADDVTCWQMKHGLFWSKEENGFLVPEFGHITFNELDEPENIMAEVKSVPNYLNKQPIYRLEPENIRTSNKMKQKAGEVVSKTKQDDPAKLGPYQNAE